MGANNGYNDNYMNNSYNNGYHKPKVSQYEDPYTYNPRYNPSTYSDYGGTTYNGSSYSRKPANRGVYNFATGKYETAYNGYGYGNKYTANGLTYDASQSLQTNGKGYGSGGFTKNKIVLQYLGDSSDTAGTGSGNSIDESDFGYYDYRKGELVEVDRAVFSQPLYNAKGYGSYATY